MGITLFSFFFFLNQRFRVFMTPLSQYVLGFGFSSLMNSISCTKQWNLFLHFLRTLKHLSGSYPSFSCKVIAVVDTPRIHYPHIYLDNGVMKTPKCRFISLVFTCLCIIQLLRGVAMFIMFQTFAPEQNFLRKDYFGMQILCHTLFSALAKDFYYLQP